ncbi:MAG: DUF1573 domain-containing protein [Lewinellaceae bacterium]|nr:DUF1573 domain-containing protein [Lewinellaceae bacterium]
MRNYINIRARYIFQSLFVAVLLTLHLNGFSQNIEFEKDTFDFGEIHYDPRVKQYLKFRNTGADTLRFLAVPKTACGCDVASNKDNKMAYAPGEEGVVVYAFDTRGYGKYRKTITIRTNSTEEYKVLRVKWEIIPTVKQE